ncbi:MAG: alpha/beta fold hydrolase [Gammaproteobacteria bacterium]|nr:MAG: alpha/beta fold hydrolase [Gammaproteobacteria bacterium]
MPERPQWEREGQDWPNREASRFDLAEGLRWHLQVMGQGPRLLLVHGTGAATHSWGGLVPLLAERFEVLAPDLPGHGFTASPSGTALSLPWMAHALGGLLRRLGKAPDLVVGHSAGAAILARMCLDGLIAPRALISLNGALLPLRGMPGHFFSPAAKLAAATPLLPRFFAWRAASPGAVERLVESTGSSLDARGIELYRRLVSCPGHVGAALNMMANWDLAPLQRDLSHLKTPLYLVVGDRDWTVPPTDAQRVRQLVPQAQVITLPRLGHLAHEERPREVADLIGRLANAQGLPNPSGQ